MSKEFTGSFYDADYFERGKQSGKGWLENYRWMPRRSFKEAFAYIDHLELNGNCRVLEFGTAKGFLIRALRILEIDADGCDISDYALDFAPEGCWNCSTNESWESHKGHYTHVLVKDVFEHLTPEQLHETLSRIALVAPIIMCIIPMGDNGKYRIPEYHTEISHLIAEDENWWKDAFKKAGWKIKSDCNHVNGIKDNWYYNEKGNHVFVLEHNNDHS